MHKECWPEGVKGRDYLRGLGVDIIKMCIKEVCGGVNWMHLAQDAVQWWALVNTVMNFRVL
jgi:hypothetical protein